MAVGNSSGSDHGNSRQWEVEANRKTLCCVTFYSASKTITSVAAIVLQWVKLLPGVLVAHTKMSFPDLSHLLPVQCPANAPGRQHDGASLGSCYPHGSSG